MPLFTHDITTQEVRVKLNPGAGEYSSIAAALASITDNSISKRYLIKVAPGEYTEPLLNFAAKPYVSLAGSSIQTTTIFPAAITHNIFNIGAFNELSFIWLEGAGAGYAGIAVVNGGDYAQCHKVTFTDCDTNVLVSASSVDTFFYGEYIDFNGTYSYGVKVLSTGGFKAYANVENIYNLPYGGTPIGFHVDGTAAQLDVLAGGTRFIGGVAGTGIIIQNGGFADVQAVYFQSLTTGISMPNVGATPTALFSAVSMTLNTTAINIAHPTAQGSFQGSMGSATPPVISIVSTASFGISYLERLLGNKKTVEFDGLLFNLVAGANPTTTAATTAVLTATGTRLVVFGGANADAAGCSAMFQIPSDYQRGGILKVVYTTDTGTPNNFKLNFILTKKVVGDDFATTTETGLNVTHASTTAYQKRITNAVTPTTTFAVGDNIVVRMYRLGNDVADTFTSSVYIVNLLFEYESNK